MDADSLVSDARWPAHGAARAPGGQEAGARGAAPSSRSFFFLFPPLPNASRPRSRRLLDGVSFRTMLPLFMWFVSSSASLFACRRRGAVAPRVARASHGRRPSITRGRWALGRGHARCTANTHTHTHTHEKNAKTWRSKFAAQVADPPPFRSLLPSPSSRRSRHPSPPPPPPPPASPQGLSSGAPLRPYRPRADPPGQLRRDSVRRASRRSERVRALSSRWVFRGGSEAGRPLRPRGRRFRPRPPPRPFGSTAWSTTSSESPT